MPSVVPHTPVGLQFGLEETDQDKLGEVRNSSSTDFRNPDNQQNRSTSFFNQGELANQRQATAQTGQYQRGELQEGQEKVAETAKQDAREISLRAQQIQQEGALRGETIQNEAAYRQATLEMQQNKLSSLNDYRGETVQDRQQALGDAFTKNLVAAQQKGQQIDANQILHQTLLQLQQARQGTNQERADTDQQRLNATRSNNAARIAAGDRKEQLEPLIDQQTGTRELWEKLAAQPTPDAPKDAADHQAKVADALTKYLAATKAIQDFVKPQDQAPNTNPSSGAATQGGGSPIGSAPPGAAPPQTLPGQGVGQPQPLPGSSPPQGNAVSSGPSQQRTRPPQTVQYPPEFHTMNDKAKAKWYQQNLQPGDRVPVGNGFKIAQPSDIAYYNNIAGQDGGQ